MAVREREEVHEVIARLPVRVAGNPESHDGQAVLSKEAQRVVGKPCLESIQLPRRSVIGAKLEQSSGGRASSCSQNRALTSSGAGWLGGCRWNDVSYST